MVESTDFGAVALQLLVELVQHVVIFGYTTLIVEVQMSPVQESIGVPGGRLLLTQVRMRSLNSLLVCVAVSIFSRQIDRLILPILSGWESLQTVSLACVDLVW